MRRRDDDLTDLAALTAARNREPRWQEVAVGTRVKPVGRPSRFGTVVEIVARDEDSRVTTRVQVRWDPFKRSTETWLTDCLVIAQETERQHDQPR